MMQPFNPAPFLAALRAVFNVGPTAVALSEQDLIFMANYRCQPAERLHYPSYQQFLEHIGNGMLCPDLPNAEPYYEVYSLLRAEALEQQVKMLGAIEEGKPNWRRFCWLLERRDKQARLKKQAAPKAAKSTKDLPVEEPATPIDQVVLESPEVEALLADADAPKSTKPANKPAMVCLTPIGSISHLADNAPEPPTQKEEEELKKPEKANITGRYTQQQKQPSKRLWYMR